MTTKIDYPALLSNMRFLTRIMERNRRVMLFALLNPLFFLSFFGFELMQPDAGNPRN